MLRESTRDFHHSLLGPRGRSDASPRRRSWLAVALGLGTVLGGCTRGEPTSTAPTASTSPSSDSATGTTAAAEGSATASTASTAPPTSSTSAASSTGSTSNADSTTDAGSPLADVLGVSARGTSLSVELQSPDLGCSQYADWWEVVTPEGELVYRRVLAHSHVDEQPFTRSGGPVDVGADDTVIVRAHMNPGGYGGQAMRGSVGAGFSVDATITASFAQNLETSEPLPSGCAF